MLNNDKDYYKFALNDDDEYDDVEEEYEEVDEDDPDAEYDDYDEAEDDYADDEYDDDEYAEDGYADDYYDDRLNKALDEIAEIKKNLNSPATAVPPLYNSVQPVVPPVVYPQQPNNGNSEVVMYNEISRLRDELSKTQNSQTMQLELTRLRNEMERDNKSRELQYTAEIRRLNEKYEELLKNAEGAPNSDVPGLESAKAAKAEQLSSERISSLVSVNEAVLHSTQDLGSKLQSELSGVKSEIGSVKSELGNVKKRIEGISVTAPELDLTAVLDAIKKNSKLGGNTEVVSQINKLNAQVDAMRSDLDVAALKINPVIYADMSGLVKQIYDLKAALGMGCDAEVREMFDALSQVNYVVSQHESTFSQKINAIYELAARVEKYLTNSKNPDSAVVSVILPLNKLISDLSSANLNRTNYEALLKVANIYPKFDLNIMKRDQTERYLRLLERCESAPSDNYMALVPEITDEKNIVEGNVYRAENENRSTAFVEYSMSDEPNELRVKEMFRELSEIEINHVFTLPKVTLPSSFDNASEEVPNSIFSELAEIKAALSSADTNSTDEHFADLISMISNLSDKVEAVTSDMKLLGTIKEINNNYYSMFAKINDIKDELDVFRGEFKSSARKADTVDSAKPVSNDAINELNDNVTAVTETVTAIGDNLTAIGDSVTVVSDNVTAVSDNITAVVESIADLGDKVTASIDTVSAVNDNVNHAIDLVEPLSADVAMTADDVKTVLDILENRDEQLAQIQADVADALAAINAVRDTRIVTDNTEIVDTINTDLGDMRADVKAVYDISVATSDAVNNLKDDLIAAVGADAFNAIEDELTAVHTDVATVSADVLAVRDSVAALSEDFNAKADNTEAIEDLRAIITSRVDDEAAERATIHDELTATREDMVAVRDEIAAMSGAMESSNNDVHTTAESISIIMDDLSSVLEKIELFEKTAEDNRNAIIAELASSDVLTRIDELAKNNENDRDTLLAGLADIKDEVHNKELASSLDGVGVNGENRDILIADIQTIRERLDGIEQSMTSSETYAPQFESILNKLDDLDAALGAQHEKGDYDLVTEILSLREDIKAARIVDQNDVSSEIEAVKNELAAISSNSILDEIRSMRDDIAALRDSGSIQRTVVSEDSEVATNDEINLVLNEIVSLRDEVQSFKEEMTTVHERPEQEYVSETETVQTATVEGLETVLDELSILRNEQSVITEDLGELKNIISRRTTIVADDSAAPSTSTELNVVLSEVINVKNSIEDIEQVTNASLIDLNARLDSLNASVDTINAVEPVAPVEVPDYSDKFDILTQQINDLYASFTNLRDETQAVSKAESETLVSEIGSMRDALNDVMSIALQPTQADNGETSYAALIEEIQNLKKEIVTVKSMAAAPAPAPIDAESLAELRAEIAELKSYVAVPQETAEISALREEVAELRSTLSNHNDTRQLLETINALRNDIAASTDIAPAPVEDSNADLGIFEDLTAIKQDVRSLKDEPDLGVMSEILALRDEFQNLREQIEGVKNVKESDNKISENLSVEMQSFTDRLSSLEDVINDIKTTTQKIEVAPDQKVLDEINSLREQIFTINMAHISDAQTGNVSYESYNNLILDELSSLREEIPTLSSGEDIADITDSVNRIQNDIAAHTDALDEIATKVNAIDISSMTATNDEVKAELDALKNELAAQREADLTTLNFMSEMARIVDKQNKFLTTVADSDFVEKLDALKSEIASTGKISSDIAEIKETMLAGKEMETDKDLSQSLDDLKHDLKHIAGIVDEKPEIKRQDALSSADKKAGENYARQIAATLSNDPVISGMIKSGAGVDVLKFVVNEKAAEEIAKIVPDASTKFSSFIQRKTLSFIGENVKNR